MSLPQTNMYLACQLGKLLYDLIKKSKQRKCTIKDYILSMYITSDEVLMMVIFFYKPNIIQYFI